MLLIMFLSDSVKMRVFSRERRGEREESTANGREIRGGGGVSAIRNGEVGEK